jgi:hypothetical protein
LPYQRQAGAARLARGVGIGQLRLGRSGAAASFATVSMNIFLNGIAAMTTSIPQLLRRSSILLVLLSSGLVVPLAAVGQGDCEAMPAGRNRTDCFIGRARILNQRSNIARDKARLQSNRAHLQATTGASGPSAAVLCQGKGVGTRACYSCCRRYGLAASTCLRNCRRR